LQHPASAAKLRVDEHTQAGIQRRGTLAGQNGSVKIICTGLNYAGHISEQGMQPPAQPLLFGKFETTLIGPGEAIVLPPEATHVDSEAELAVEIGRRGRRIHEDDALDFVAGYRCANDVSARNLQYGDKQWTRGKGFDTFCPLGDRLVPVSELGDGSGLRVTQRLNGELLQDGNTRELVFGVRRLIAFASAVFTLLPGDLILTGTPSGIGYARTPPLSMRAGDLVEVEIQGIGLLANPVVAESL
jgi:2-keto-4-pentenoate hydratase/2-oxohepta-3-ene-1,7-dioic acid hydratase in catechol pathway